MYRIKLQVNTITNLRRYMIQKRHLWFIWSVMTDKKENEIIFNNKEDAQKTCDRWNESSSWK